MIISLFDLRNLNVLFDLQVNFKGADGLSALNNGPGGAVGTGCARRFHVYGQVNFFTGVNSFGEVETIGIFLEFCTADVFVVHVVRIPGSCTGVLDDPMHVKVIVGGHAGTKSGRLGFDLAL